MKITLLRSYRSKNGTPTFVYTVAGKASELESFKVAQGEYYREDDKSGAPLWFTTRCVGDHGTLIITENGKVVPDMSEFDKAASMVAQYGGNFGQVLAQQAVSNLLGKTPTQADVPQAQPSPKGEDLSGF